MAYLSLQLENAAVASPAPFNDTGMLADALRHALREHHPHLLDTVKFDEPTPINALTLSHWAQPGTLNALMTTYGDHLYAQHIEQAWEVKPLKSLWAQWYVGLLTPALMAIVLTHPQGLRLSPDVIRARFHETGRVESFWIDVYPYPESASLSLRERMEYLVGNVLMPVVDALEESGDINGRLIWSNTGYLINWFLGELKPRLGEAAWQLLRQACFFEKTRLDGRDNPLYRTVVPREGLLVRRTCCQRNRLPGVQQCGDCTLK
ncbi:siderophore-iron reductase FhuF [Atlantibacter sp.]|uniref:siderophore-iron reductase FhuF n=1 Tax=Atlantibacter sp. TaxID=1903473 RepID=UPI0028A73ACF|nr:siderophore-iron reductase FhuF [Atlantibacter sp.]